MKASELNQDMDYPSFPEFKKYNIPLDRVDAALIIVLQRLRTVSGVPIYPSPLPDAWARMSGSATSRHYAVDRLSDAGDMFPERGRFMELFFRAQQMPEIGGIGVYADTTGPDGKPWPMLHIDLRPVDRCRTIWARGGGYQGSGGVYCVLGVDNKGFNDVVREILKYDRKAWGL